MPRARASCTARRSASANLPEFLRPTPELRELDPPFMGRNHRHRFRVIRPNERFIQRPRLWMRIRVVLRQRRFDVLADEPTEARHDAPRSMTALIAVDEQRILGVREGKGERGVERGWGCGFLAGLVGRDAKLNVLDAVGVDPGTVAGGLGRVRDERQDGSELQGEQKAAVFFLWESAPVYAAGDHGPVIDRWD
jgi:hypothetical protein